MPRVIDPEEVEADQLRRMVDLRSKQVLEIGCGVGRLTACYAEDAAHVLGMDIKTEDLVTARSSLPVAARGAFAVANVQRIPCPSSSFDIVIFARSL